MIAPARLIGATTRPLVAPKIAVASADLHDDRARV